eukprot:m.403280 g.403280  ORF g.403280 m.403280 type:complete len:61 (-) comp28407_c0_seq10:142-324(-)
MSTLSLTSECLDVSGLNMFFAFISPPLPVSGLKVYLRQSLCLFATVCATMCACVCTGGKK